MSNHKRNRNNTLCNLLSARIREFKSKNLDLSSAEIARKWGLSSSSFNRIENLEISTPSIDHIRKILRGSGFPDEILPTLKKHHPDISSIYEELYLDEDMIRRAIEDKDPTVEEYFTNPDTFRIMILASSKSGISLDEVKSEFGRMGLEKVRELMHKDILEIGSEGRIFWNESVSKKSLSTKVTHQLFYLTAEHCVDIDNLNKKDSSLSFYADSVDQKLALPEIQKIWKRTHDEIRMVFEDLKYQGSDTVFVGFMNDTVLKGVPGTSGN